MRYGGRFWCSWKSWRMMQGCRQIWWLIIVPYPATWLKRRASSCGLRSMVLLRGPPPKSKRSWCWVGGLFEFSPTLFCVDLRKVRFFSQHIGCKAKLQKMGLQICNSPRIFVAKPPKTQKPEINSLHVFHSENMQYLITVLFCCFFRNRFRNPVSFNLFSLVSHV